MNTPQSGHQRAPPPHSRPACVPPLPDLSLLLSFTAASRAPPRPALPPGRLHAVGPKPRPLLLDRPYEVGGARNAAAALDLIPPPRHSVQQARIEGPQQSTAKTSAQHGSRRASHRSSSGLSSSATSATSSTASSRTSSSIPTASSSLSTAKHSLSHRSTPFAFSSSASTPAPSTRCPPSPSTIRTAYPLCAGAIEPKHLPLHSFRSSTRHASPLTDRLHHSAAFRGLTPRIRPATAASHQPDTAWLNGVIAGRGSAGRQEGRIQPPIRARPGPHRQEESKEAMEPQRPQRSRGAERGVGVDPDEFLAVISSDPQKAFRMIFPDHPVDKAVSASRERRSAREVRSTEQEKRQEALPQRRGATPPSAQLPSTESTLRPSYQHTGPFDVQRSANVSFRVASDCIDTQSTATFVTHFAQPKDSRAEEERVSDKESEQEGCDEDEAETRRLIRNLVRDAQQSQQPAHVDAPHSDEEIEDEVHHVPDAGEASEDEEEEEARGVQEEKVSAPQSPVSASSAVVAGRRGRGRPPSLAPPEMASGRSSSHLSPSSFTIASSAPASPAIDSGRSEGAEEEFCL